MKLTILILAVAAFATGCSTVTINVGDAAIRAASGCATNAVVSAWSVSGTNSAATHGSAAILINVTMNVPKDIKPDSTLTLTK